MSGGRVFIVPALFFAVITLHSSNVEDTNTSKNPNLISMYSINTKTDQPIVLGKSGGLFYNSQNIKLKIEKSADFVKTGAILKVNPLQDSLYFKFGANYLNQNLYNNDAIKESVNQYSGAVGVGYMLNNDLDLEFGSSRTNTDNEISNQTIQNTYCQLAKRAEIPTGTIDVTLKGNQLYQNLSTKEQTYGSTFNYYPNKNIKLGYFYTNTQNNVSNGYAINYGYLTTEYANNVSQNTYTLTVGFKAKFTDFTDFSSYIMPMTIKPTLSRLHKFDDMVLHDNMNIQM